MTKVYDVAVIGAGPGGMSATLYASRMGLNTIMIDNGVPGGQLWNTNEIDNYLGVDGGTADELANRMYRHSMKFGAKYQNDKVISVIQDNGVYTIIGDEGEYKALSLIVATGTSHNKLLPEKEEGIVGISYCTVCDAPFYEDVDVAVVGGGDSAVESAILLADVANQVYLIVRRDEFRANPQTVELAKSLDNVKILLNTKVLDIEADASDTIEYIRVVTTYGGENTVEYSLPVDGLFPNIGATPNTQFLKRLPNYNMMGNLQGQIDVDKDNKLSFRHYTTDPYYVHDGLFFVGDITSNLNQQVAIAVGDGANSALNAYKYVLSVRPIKSN